ncbi:unnamed protein product [Rotaria socialis]|uniref:Uncharacterized protein n=1 Tax=Rotaria socialis TaxID=392032 RepID=A0A820LM73_9BILA|nr:unnamed protein product [Rotaria socialis]CAF3579558.1 unnamed protein product [Rotaria socialis]CAF3702095.1 unnamed protein product [Rotaria socialis]CAF4359619.1 unnamed protein product [Rotaria socialis]CAF4363948.1 unnamed protein product [Rotaria socialis]
MMNSNAIKPQEQYVPPPYNYPRWQGQQQMPGQIQYVQPYDSAEINNIHDWLPWSIINIFIGFLFAGILPLIFSIVCRNRKRENNVHGARATSTLALVFNILVTLGGIAGWIGLIVVIVILTRAVENVATTSCLTYPFCR